MHSTTRNNTYRSTKASALSAMPTLSTFSTYVVSCRSNLSRIVCRQGGVAADDAVRGTLSMLPMLGQRGPLAPLSLEGTSPKVIEIAFSVEAVDPGFYWVHQKTNREVVMTAYLILTGRALLFNVGFW